mgnify:CR=1 FL=1
MIKLINVPSFNAGLMQAVEFCQKHEKEKIEIVVPDKLSLFMEKFLFEQMQLECSFNIKVSTLNRFAKRSNQIGKDSQISKVGSIVLIHKILTENINNLKALKSKAYSFSYAENIYKTIAQLKASKITWQEMSTFKSVNQQLNDKIADLALIFEEYENGKAGLLDSFDLFLMSALTVEKVHFNKTILFVGFDDFTAIEYAIIERLAFNNNVNILTCWGNGANKHIFNAEIYEQLKNIAYVNELEFKVEYANPTNSELKTFLQTNLFGIENSTFCLNKETIKIYSAKDDADELEFVAREIRAGILQGKNYSNYGVAVYGLENKIEKIKEIFNKYEINAYFDVPFSLSNSIFYKFLLTVFKFNLENYNLVHLVDIINSPFFAMENELKTKLIEKFTLMNFKGKISRDFNLGSELEEAKQQLLDFVDLFIMDKDISATNIKQMLISANQQIKFDEVLENLSQHVHIAERLLLSKSKEAVFSLLDEIEKFYPFAGLAEIYDIYSHISSVVSINNLPLTLDAVKVVDADSFSEIFSRLYLVGCNADVAPSLKFDCGIILDTEIPELNFKNKLSPTIAHINSLSKLRLFNTALMFNDSLTVTYSKIPSELIREFINKIQVEIAGKKVNLVPINAFNLGEYKLLSKNDFIENACKNLKNNQNIAKICNFSLNNLNKNEILNNILIKKDFSNISKDNLIIYENMKTISASQLESYFKCPFYYFASNILKVKPRLSGEIQSLDVGNILHEILFEYYKRKKQVGDIYDFCRTQIFNFVDANDRLRINVNSPILIALIDEAVRVINGLNYIDENSSFKPHLFEFEFKGKTALNLGNVNLVGKVDRVDKFEDYLRVVDYKSGKADASLKELYYGNKLQLFLYSCAMENVSNNYVAGQFYLPLHNEYRREPKNPYSLKGFFVQDEKVLQAFDTRLGTSTNKSDIVNVTLTNAKLARKTKGYKELQFKEMHNLKEYSKAVSALAVDEIKSGFIKPTPSSVSEPCNFCPYSHICLKSCNNIKLRQENKVNLESFKGEEE